MSPGQPEVFNFYTYLRTHPLLLRRHFGSSEKPSAKGLTAESRRLADSINLVERRLFFTAAYAHFQAGCPMLALEVLSKMPKVVKKSRPQTVLLTPTEVKPVKASDLDWSQPVVNGYESACNSLSNSQSDSVLSFDWSQPSVTIPDEPLELKWDSDKDDSDDEESGLAMKNLSAENDGVFKGTSDSATSPAESPEQDDDDTIGPSEDILTAQLKFSACLKILTTELRTLSTGYELDGGKLRHQLCHWLEREVAALQRSCGYNPSLQEVAEGIAGEAGQAEAEGTARAAAAGEWQVRRRRWLRRNQPLLRMFLSYCSLHGSHGGGLASVRMELILLLQESQQVNTPNPPVTPQHDRAMTRLAPHCQLRMSGPYFSPVTQLHTHTNATSS